MYATEVIGQRVLVKLKSAHYGYRAEEIQEVTLLELSPSQHFVKIQNLHGNKFWRPITDVTVIEKLHQLERNPGK